MWDHQLAILNRCLVIENIKGGTRGAIGVVGDEPGAGKTYVMVALQMSSPRGRTLVVVPHNIYGQWQRDIARFAPALRTMCFVDYAAITSVYAKGAAKIFDGADIVLTTSLYYQTIAAALEKSECPPFARTIFDEADSTSNMLVGPTLPSRFVWLVTASFERLVGSDGLVRAGPYVAPPASIQGCRCDPRFVAKSIPLQDPIVRVVKCVSQHMDIMAPMFPRQPTAVHTYDFATLVNRSVTCVRDALRLKITALQEEIAYCTDAIETKRNGTNVEKLEKRLKEATEVLEGAKKRISDAKICPVCLDACVDIVHLPCCTSATFCRDCIVEWIAKRTDEKAEPGCPLCREVITKRFLPSGSVINNSEVASPAASSGEAFPKLDELFNILAVRFGESSQTRVFVFSNNAVILSRIARRARDELGIESAALDGGTAKSIDDDAMRYRTGNAHLMLADSSLFGCGMNFPETTDVILMHRMSEIQEKQVVGRAQRPGRTTRLRVYKMLHSSE